MPSSFIPPSFFPPDCPPLPHVENNGVYIRLTWNSTGPILEDFMSYYQLGHSSRGSGARCKDCSLSLFDDETRAMNFLLNFPTFGQRNMAVMNLDGGHGVVKSDGSSLPGHVLWWVPDGVSPLNYYSRMVVIHE